jgi:diaminohydroxyphosphoribosylaminopyrimidine deaminase/5-amino-6-(5-phosphoribosylamino)uracil reductase
LNNRFWFNQKQPVRVVIDFENSLPDDLFLKDQQQETIIFNEKKEGKEGAINWKHLSKTKPLIPQIIEGLNFVNSLIVEGGAKTLQAFIDEGFWDEIHLWKSDNKTLGSGIIAPKLKQAKLMDLLQLNEDKLFLFVPEENPQ